MNDVNTLQNMQRYVKHFVNPLPDNFTSVPSIPCNKFLVLAGRAQFDSIGYASDTTVTAPGRTAGPRRAGQSA